MTRDRYEDELNQIELKEKRKGWYIFQGLIGVALAIYGFSIAFRSEDFREAFKFLAINSAVIIVLLLITLMIFLPIAWLRQWIESQPAVFKPKRDWEKELFNQLRAYTEENKAVTYQKGSDRIMFIGYQELTAFYVENGSSESMLLSRFLDRIKDAEVIEIGHVSDMIKKAME